MSKPSVILLLTILRRESLPNSDRQVHSTSEDNSPEDLECPSPKGAKHLIMHLTLNCQQVNILTAAVPDIGLFTIVKMQNSAASHDRLKAEV